MQSSHDIFVTISMHQPTQGRGASLLSSWFNMRLFVVLMCAVTQGRGASLFHEQSSLGRRDPRRTLHPVALRRRPWRARPRVQQPFCARDEL